MCDFRRLDLPGRMAAGFLLAFIATFLVVAPARSTPLTVPLTQGSLNGCLNTSTNTSVVNGLTLLASGGSPLSGYTWTLSNLSTYPPGTTVDPLTGIFHGTTSSVVPGTYTFNMTVSDGSTQASGSFTFYVTSTSSSLGCGAEAFEQLSLQQVPLPDAVPGHAYGASLFAAGIGDDAVTPLTWTLASGALPQGLQIDAARGIVRGTTSSTASGTYQFTISVQDHNGKIADCPNGGVCPTYVINIGKGAGNDDDLDSSILQIITQLKAQQKIK